MTGSVGISGSLSVNGVLTGTSATFSSTVTAASSLTLNNAANPTINFVTNTTLSATMFSIIGASYVGSPPFNANKLVASNSSDIAFEAGGSERMRITSGGNVGIGTTSPSQKLEVVGGEIKAGRVDTSNEGGQVSFGRASDNNTAWYIDAFGSTSSPSLRFVNVSDSAVVMTISGSNVGIGTSTPYAKAEINSGADLTAIRITDPNYDNSASTFRFTVASYWARLGGTIRTGGDPLAVGGASAAIVFTDEPGNFTFNNTIRSSSIQFWTANNNNGGSVGLVPTVRMTIASNGSVSIPGSLSKGSGSFKIDHPLKPKTHYLVHSFAESPQANNIYRGKVQLVNGFAQVNLDKVSTMEEGTFVALNRDIHTYTSNETDWDAVRGTVTGNILTIECQNSESTADISWLVIGERHDKHIIDTDWTDENGRVIVEPLKALIK
jgi:hypothetical protein